MKKDFLKRTTAKVADLVEDDDKLLDDGGAKRAKAKGDRVILYVHGGAYFFSSLDTHRYQIQRHARKVSSLGLFYLERERCDSDPRAAPLLRGHPARRSSVCAVLPTRAPISLRESNSRPN